MPTQVTTTNHSLSLSTSGSCGFWCLPTNPENFPGSLDYRLLVLFDRQGMSANELETDLYFYHTDHLGSSSWITDATGSAYQHLQSLPFGEQFIEQRQSSWDAMYKFTGKERDMETGWDYFGARYLAYRQAGYDSDLSIWLSRKLSGVDPLASKFPGISGYAYVFNSPVGFVDSDGLRPIPFKVKMGDGTNVWVIAHTGDGQKFWFFSWSIGVKFFNYRSKINGRQSLGLLQQNRSKEINSSEKFSADVEKMSSTFGGYLVTQLLTNLVDQHNNITLYIIGNHYVPHLDIYENDNLSFNEKQRIKESKSILNLYTYGDNVFSYNGLEANYDNRNIEMDSKWSEDRAMFIRDEYFDNLPNIKTMSRLNTSSWIINGLELNDFGKDGMGITIGLSINSRRDKPERHKTVLNL